MRYPVDEGVIEEEVPTLTGWRKPPRGFEVFLGGIAGGALTAYGVGYSFHAIIVA